MLVIANLEISPIYPSVSFSLYPGAIVNFTSKQDFDVSSLYKKITTHKNYQKNIIFPDKDVAINILDSNPAFHDKLKIIDHLEFWAGMYGCYELVPAAIQSFDLREYLDLRYSELSKNMQQNFSLSRILCCYSDYWLFDINEDHIPNELNKYIWHLIASKAANGGIILLNNFNNISHNNYITINLEDFRVED